MSTKHPYNLSMAVWLMPLISIGLLAGQESTRRSWVRPGPLGPKPERITHVLPLSDQSNKAGWNRYEPMSDEFNGTGLDPNKWWPRNPSWLGRRPALFDASNVSVASGRLHLTMRKHEPPEMPKDKGYHTYTSAAVKSKGTVKYGYFEVRCRPMASHGSSSFWFYDSTPELWTEIDVFEIGGRAPGFEKKYNMNVHVFRTPTENKHWSDAAVWHAAENLADDYHIYALEWDSRRIKWYFDGVLVRWIDNTHWHQKLTLNFDSETMGDWFGLPKDSDLPSTYSIDYVRAWKRQEPNSTALFSDERFRGGFLLSYPDSVRGRSVQGLLNLGNVKNRPLWRLCQWSTRYSLSDAPCERGRDGDIFYENRAKRVLVGGPNSANRDLILEVRGSAEYEGAARRQGQGWPHLLIEQDTDRIIALSKLKSIDFRVTIRLLYCRNNMNDSQYDAALHAAQCQMFFIVKNINEQSPSHGSYYWFGVPFFDSRHDIPPLYMGKDAGKEDATGCFIYTMDGRELTSVPLKSGKWVTIEKDLLGHIRAGLKHAAAKGYLGSADPRDYAVVNMNLGWEIPGSFDAAVQIRDLEVLAGL
jgi:beta-glucanase (GH16 family)